ncbi:MAG TPA: hypothetical protein VFT22_13875 [Kofleriaceae bacterium]|nr:hypothetical protein [Kofleriaceae bacterium]
MLDALRMVGCGLLFVVGCGKSAIGPDAPAGGGPTDGAPHDVPVHIPGMPGVGAHALADYHLNEFVDEHSISTPSMSTSPSGSTIVVSIGRGDNRQFVLPTDNKGNSPYQQLGMVQTYPSYPQSGTAVYAFTNATGGNDFRVSTTRNNNERGQPDEITIAAVEVLEGKTIHDFAWTSGTDDPLTSASVTTTGPATLIAFWWGDGFPGTPQEALPDNDFSPLDTNAQELDSFVQCAVAAKNVSSPGTYNVTWKATPPQGAQLWLIAVQ